MYVLVIDGLIKIALNIFARICFVKINQGGSGATGGR